MKHKTTIRTMMFILGWDAIDVEVSLSKHRDDDLDFPEGYWEDVINGRVPMHPIDAQNLQGETGIDSEWLLGSDTGKPVTVNGDPFTRETFAMHQVFMLCKRFEDEKERSRTIDDYILGLIDDIKNDYTRKRGNLHFDLHSKANIAFTLRSLREYIYLDVNKTLYPCKKYIL